MSVTMKREGGFSITLSDKFIYEYMPAARGEQVKVYLYLLAAMEKGYLDVNEGAEILDVTDRVFMRCVDYWAEKGLLRAEYDKKMLTGITFLSPDGSESQLKPAEAKEAVNEAEAAPAVSAVPVSAPEIQAPTRPVLSPEEIRAIEEDPGFKEVMSLAQMHYFKKLIGGNDYDKFLLFYNSMKSFGVETCIELITYCGNKKGIKDKKDKMSYLDAVSCNVLNTGVRTGKEFSDELLRYDRRIMIMKAFGMDSFPGAFEEYLNRWFYEYKMPDDVVQLALDKSAKTGKPIDYTDAIIKKWVEKDIRTLAAVKAEADAYSKDLNAQYKAKKGYDKNANNRFNQFEQREHDFNAEAAAAFRKKD